MRVAAALATLTLSGLLSAPVSAQTPPPETTPPPEPEAPPLEAVEPTTPPDPALPTAIPTTPPDPLPPADPAPPTKTGRTNRPNQTGTKEPVNYDIEDDPSAPTGVTEAQLDEALRPFRPAAAQCGRQNGVELV